MKDHINNIIVGVLAAVIAGVVLFLILPNPDDAISSEKDASRTMVTSPIIQGNKNDDQPLVDFEEKTIEYEIAYRKGVAAVETGYYDEAIKHLESILSYDLTVNIEASTYGNLGIAYKESNRMVDAIAMYEKACSLNKLYCGLSEFNKARMYEQNSAYKNALSSYKKVIELEPQNMFERILSGYKNIDFQSNFYIGNILSTQYKNCPEAIKHYKKSLISYDEEALGINDWKLEALNNLSFCYFEIGDFENVILTSQQILYYNEYDKDALIAIAYSYGNLGDESRAKII